MAYYSIPLSAVPSQQVVCDLSGKQVNIITRQMGGRQYLSVSVAGKVICKNVLIVDRSYLINAPYLGFAGDFICVDMQGNEMPSFTGWNTRFLLFYNDGK